MHQCTHLSEITPSIIVPLPWKCMILSSIWWTGLKSINRFQFFYNHSWSYFPRKLKSVALPHHSTFWTTAYGECPASSANPLYIWTPSMKKSFHTDTNSNSLKLAYSIELSSVFLGKDFHLDAAQCNPVRSWKLGKWYHVRCNWLILLQFKYWMGFFVLGGLGRFVLFGVPCCFVFLTV